MLDKPRLADEKITACLKETYGLTAARLEFLPRGYDAYAGVYRVQAGGAVEAAHRRRAMRSGTNTYRQGSKVVLAYI